MFDIVVDLLFDFIEFFPGIIAVFLIFTMFNKAIHK